MGRRCPADDIDRLVSSAFEDGIEDGGHLPRLEVLELAVEPFQHHGRLPLHRARTPAARPQPAHDHGGSEPRPTTSPIATPTRPPGRLNTSYQSPPTPPSPAGRYRAANSRPGTLGSRWVSGCVCSAAAAACSMFERRASTASATRSRPSARTRRPRAEQTARQRPDVDHSDDPALRRPAGTPSRLRSPSREDRVEAPRSDRRPR